MLRHTKLLFSGLAFALSAIAHAELFDGHVARIISGDMVLVEKGDGISIPLSLSGIDAPEPDQDFGLEAKSALSEQLLGKAVLVRLDEATEGQAAIRSGQIACGDADAGLSLLEKGLAWASTDQAYTLPDAWKDAYREAEMRAKEHRTGLWQSQRPVPPWSWRKVKREEDKKQKSEANLSEISSEVTEKFYDIQGAIVEYNSADQEERSSVDKKPTYWQLFSDFGEVLSRWIVAFLKSFV